VQSYDWDPGLQSHVHYLGDLPCEHLAKGAAEDCEIMREQVHESSIDPCVSRDNSVTQNLLVRHSKVYSLMYDKAVDFDETARVDESVYSLAGCHLSPRMLRLNLFRAAANLSLLSFFLQL